MLVFWPARHHWTKAFAGRREDRIAGKPKIDLFASVLLSSLVNPKLAIAEEKEPQCNYLLATTALGNCWS